MIIKLIIVLITVLIAVLSTGCGQPEQFIASELQAEFDAYRTECTNSAACNQLPANWSVSMYTVDSLPDGAAGYCTSTGDIYIRTNVKATEWELKAIIYHELAHCVHSLGHVSGSPIMHEVTYRIESETQWNEAITELFTTQMQSKLTQLTTGVN